MVFTSRRFLFLVAISPTTEIFCSDGILSKILLVGYITWLSRFLYGRVIDHDRIQSSIVEQYQ